MADAQRFSKGDTVTWDKNNSLKFSQDRHIKEYGPGPFKVVEVLDGVYSTEQNIVIEKDGEIVKSLVDGHSIPFHGSWFTKF